MRIGIDVGGTNTDAVLMDGTDLIAQVKSPTTPDVTSGILTAIESVYKVSFHESIWVKMDAEEVFPAR